MKKPIVTAMLSALTLTVLSVRAFPQAMTLDEAIKTTAAELGQQINANKIPNINSSNQSIERTAEEIRRQLTAQTKIAVLSFSSDWRELSTYVIDELNTAIVRNGSLTVVNRQQLNLVRQELDLQESGDVSDASAQSKGKFLGAQSVLTGSFTKIGNTYRFRVRVIAVETGVEQYSNSIEIKNDKVLTALMPKASKAAKTSRPSREPREPPETSPVFIFDGDVGGGNIFGVEIQLGLQFGVSVNSFNFLLDTAGGYVIGDSELAGCYHVGGLIEYGIAKTVYFGAGGGIGGNTLVSDDFYPYVRGSASVSLFDNILKLAAYYDYTFDYGSRFGIKVCTDLTFLF